MLSGSRQPKAFTLTTSIRHQATRMPSGSASSAVSSASAIGLRKLQCGDLPSRQTDRPQRRKLRQPRLAERQQAGEQRDAGDAQRERIQRGGDGKGAAEDAAGLGLRRRLVGDVGAAEPAVERGQQRGEVVRRNAHAETRAFGIGETAHQLIGIDDDLPLRVAVIGIEPPTRTVQHAGRGGDADSFAELQTQPPAQLLADQHRRPVAHAIPGIRR